MCLSLLMFRKNAGNLYNFRSHFTSGFIYLCMYSCVKEESYLSNNNMKPDASDLEKSSKSPLCQLYQFFMTSIVTFI
jgi:hypothetical protein